MAFPAIVGTPTAGSTSSANDAHTVMFPSYSAGDRMLVFFGCDGEETITFPGTFNKFLDALSDGEVRISVAYRDMVGSEGANISVATSDDEKVCWQCYVIDAGTFDPATPPAGATAVGTSAAPNPPSLNPAAWDVEDTLWFAAMFLDDEATIGAPANYTNLVYTPSGGSGGDNSLAVARRTIAEASQDPGTFSSSENEQWGAVTVAIRPVVEDEEEPEIVEFDPAELELAAPTFNVSAATVVSFDAATVTIQAPEFVAANPTIVAFAAAELTLEAPEFAAIEATTIAFDAATLTLEAPAFVAAAAEIAPFEAATITLAAPEFEAIAATVVAFDPATLALAAPTFNVAAAEIVAFDTATLTIEAPAFEAVSAAAVQFDAAELSVLAPVFNVSAAERIQFDVATLALHAPEFVVEQGGIVQFEPAVLRLVTPAFIIAAQGTPSGGMMAARYARPKPGLGLGMGL